MIYQHLFDRVKEPETVHAGVIGCGDFGTTIISQAPLIPRLEIPVVADIDLEAGRSAFQRAGIADDDIVVCNSRASALRSMESGKSVVVQDAMIMMGLPLDVIATATRVPESGARYAYGAIQHGGPILKHLADRAGVVFTTDDGDEPGLLMGLVSWAKNLGLEVLCGGNMHNCLYDPTEATVKSRSVIVKASEEDRWAWIAYLPEKPSDMLRHVVACSLISDPTKNVETLCVTWQFQRMGQDCCPTSLLAIALL